ncbi:uncharacterized protein LOC105699666 [Orussus abietinus]|uniref:uncharacterized protein LOC105699666 n=1 Tax=Orussus abietinus TaxID=222816 RepID=UPI000C7160AA|nr:uncharacterized protein LOC105699666 [Orussus abietinus]
MGLLHIFLACGLLRGILGINMTEECIPKLVRAETEDPVILDCKYEMGSSPNTSLVIKWYIGDDLLYQWIYGDKPKASQEFKKYIDEKYKASDNPVTMYRAVKLVRPGHELSGNVRCVISTQYTEVEASNKMLVYSPEKLLRFSHPRQNGSPGNLTLTCLAEELYPSPTITIRRDQKPIERQEHNYQNTADGRFTVEAIAHVEVNETQLPTTFQCEVSIPEANYTSIREYVYNGGDLPCLSLLAVMVGAIIISRQ